MAKVEKCDVLRHLQNTISMEIDERGAVYYLHITEDGMMVDDHSKADMTFAAVLDPEAYEDFASDYDWRDDVEVEENKYFAAVVAKIVDDANEYLGLGRGNCEFFVIGGQYEHCYYGSTTSLQSAKIMATKNIEYWDNFAGWRKPRIYDQDNVVKIITKGRVLYPDGCEIYVPVENASFLQWDDDIGKWVQNEEMKKWE